VEYVENLLGVPLAAGGEHPQMATHNQLLSLGPDLYLEVIAINSDADAPKHARWFDLDRFSGQARLTNWIVTTDDIQAAVAGLPKGNWQIMDLHRGNLRWQMGVPTDGRLPFDGAFPALIQWAGAQHPAQNLPDQGCRMQRLIITHPEAEALKAALPQSIDLARIKIVFGDQRKLAAEILTPGGLKLLA